MSKGFGKFLPASLTSYISNFQLSLVPSIPQPLTEISAKHSHSETLKELHELLETGF
jgi:hypothetical protein